MTKPKCKATVYNVEANEWYICNRDAVLEYRSNEYVHPLCLRHVGQAYV